MCSTGLLPGSPHAPLAPFFEPLVEDANDIGVVALNGNSFVSGRGEQELQHRTKFRLVAGGALLFSRALSAIARKPRPTGGASDGGASDRHNCFDSYRSLYSFDGRSLSLQVPSR